MTALAIGNNEKADVQVELSTMTVDRTGPFAVTRSVPFEVDERVIASGRAPHRPNRNRPFNPPSLEELMSLAKDNPPPAEFFEGEAECPW